MKLPIILTSLLAISCSESAFTGGSANRSISSTDEDGGFSHTSDGLGEGWTDDNGDGIFDNSKGEETLDW